MEEPPADDIPGSTYYEDYWEDREASRKLAPVFSNRAFVQQMGDGMLRVNFGQITDEGPDYYTAVVMTAHNAFMVAKLIERYATALMAPPPMVRMNTPAPPAQETGQENGDG